MINTQKKRIFFNGKENLKLKEKKGRREKTEVAKKKIDTHNNLSSFI